MGDHELDPQALAFRGATAADLVTDAQLSDMLAAGQLVDTTDAPVVPVEDFEAADWDAGRVGPKSLDEAKAALAARVEDPNAPDRDATAYDDLDGS